MSSVSQKGLGGFVDYWVLEKTEPSPIFSIDFCCFLEPERSGPSQNYSSRFSWFFFRKQWLRTIFADGIQMNMVVFHSFQKLGRQKKRSRTLLLLSRLLRQMRNSHADLCTASKNRPKSLLPQEKLTKPGWIIRRGPTPSWLQKTKKSFKKSAVVQFFWIPLINELHRQSCRDHSFLIDRILANQWLLL